MKKFLSIILTAVLVFGALAGCKGSDEPVDYDIDLSVKPELNMLFPSSGRDDSIYRADSTIPIIEEITGYKINYSQLAAADQNALNLALINRSQYNAIKVNKQQFNELAAEDALLELGPVIEKFGNNLKKSSVINSWDSVTYNGKVYGIPERASSDNVEWGIVIRKDWLADYALPKPQTKEQLKQVLLTIKEEKEKGTTAKFYPLTFDKDNAFVRAILPAFDIYGEWTDVNGSLKFYMEMPGMKDYLNYMIDLNNCGLIDLGVATNELSNSINKFTAGSAAAIVVSCWSASALVLGLKGSGQAASDSDALNRLEYIPGLKNSAGELKTMRSSGVPYVTVIPKYMAKNAGYVIDFIDKKLEGEAFTQIVLGTKDEHYYIDGNGNYLPMAGGKFEEKNNSADYLTGSNETLYPKLWQARVRKNEAVFKCWEAFMKDVETIGVRNPVALSPVLENYSKLKTTIEVPVLDYLLKAIFTDKSTANYDSVFAKWKADGGTASAAEINDWYKK